MKTKEEIEKEFKEYILQKAHEAQKVQLTGEEEGIVELTPEEIQKSLTMYGFPIKVKYPKDFISQTRQADVDGLIEWAHSMNQDHELLIGDNRQFAAGFNRALEYITTHLTKLKENI